MVMNNNNTTAVSQVNHMRSQQSKHYFRRSGNREVKCFQKFVDISKKTRN